MSALQEKLFVLVGALQILMLFARTMEYLEPKLFPFSFLVSWGGVKPSPFGTSATIWLLYQPELKDDNECGAVGGIICQDRLKHSNLHQCLFVH
jgi:hypothetical protein